MSDNQTDPRPADEFARQAEQKRAGVIGEYLAFVRHNKKWWLLPILAILLLVSVMVVIGGTAAGPWLYALF